MDIILSSKSKTLPMFYSPPTTTYHFCSDLLAVLCNYEEAFPWIFNNFVQLKYFVGQRYQALEFYTPALWNICPWIYHQRISKDLAAKGWDSITKELSMLLIS